MTPAGEVRAVFRDAGVRGWLHVRPVSGDRARGDVPEVDAGAHVPVVMASVYKLFVLVAYCREVDDGAIDPREPVVVPVRRTPGGTGISALADPVTMSRRDLVTSMVTASDNAAADVVHTRVGRDRVAALPAELGLAGTRSPSTPTPPAATPPCRGRTRRSAPPRGSRCTRCARPRSEAGSAGGQPLPGGRDQRRDPHRQRRLDHRRVAG